MVVLVCRRDVTYHIVQGARPERCNVGNRAFCRSRPDDTGNGTARGRGVRAITRSPCISKSQRPGVCFEAVRLTCSDT